MLEFVAIPVPQEKAICIVMRTPKTNYYMEREIPPVIEGKKRMTMNIGCLYAQSVSNSQSKVTFIAQVNPNIVITT